MHACETIYLCTCVRLHIFVCVWDYILCMCVRLPFATSRWLYLNIHSITTKTLWNHLTLYEMKKFSNLKKCQVRMRFSAIKWFQLKKWWIPKLYNSSRSTTFILIISSSDKVILNIVHKSTCFSYSSWNYESCEFMNNIY